ncbi:MAG: AtpZ/AtpI family protein [Clostridia bacterium]|nr:AtpZ/AtpI family protein [Clostridia bacterium]
MHKKIFGVMYALNVISQAAISLLTPAALGFGIAWLLVRYVGVAEWIYAVLIPIGVVCGFISMIKFVVSASHALERLEKQNEDRN